MATNNSVNTGLSGATGTGNFVGATSPTLVTPTLGAAFATSINFGGSTLNTFATGSWTPGLAFGGGSTGIVYTNQLGEYTQIGNLVIVGFLITTSSVGSSTGNATITGLPIASANTTLMGNIYQNLFYTNITYTTNIGIGPVAGTTRLLFAQTNNTANITNTAFANGTSVAGVFIYFSS